MEKKNNDKKFKKKFNRKTLKRFLKKRNLIFTAVVLLVALAVYFARGGAGPMSGNLATTSQIDDNSYNQSKIMRVDLNKIKTIDFDLETCDVRIQKSTTNPYIEYTVLYKDDNHVYDMDVSFSEGVLKLKSKIKGKDLYMKDKMPIVRIFLPKDAGLDEIKGKITAGDVKITDLEAKNFNLAVRSGNISLDNALFKGVISNEIGSISLTKCDISETKLATTTGNINVTDSKLGNKLDFSTQNGDIIVKADKKVDEYKVSAKMSLGTFILGNVSYRNIKDGYQSENNGKYEISLRTKIGDIIFNRGEGAVLDPQEYITNKSQKTRDDEDKANDEDIRDASDKDKRGDDEDHHHHDDEEENSSQSGDQDATSQDYDTDKQSEDTKDYEENN
ncbi:DUF4097 family beta strand repeat-containing protein [uncultured Anaerococcus sp.]|uniref:DUF4097 family beta strand repeat-containing protein n=1 Tax=uncultured Anaerococcus sp. TaxID=293428 RepID=UPI00288A5BAC|nr:DUF4097 family beta strand repeat-containing protein [uncultured Anaerococcus sp.]